MADGAGHYDELCTLVRETTGARAALVIILDGNRGHGFSVQMVDDPSLKRQVPSMLRHMAAEIENG